MQTDVAGAITVAEQFGNLVAKTDYRAAHALLTAGARKIYSPDDIRWTVEGMTACREGTIRKIELEEDIVRKDWPEKQRGDIALIRVRLIGDVFVEAVTMVVAEEAGTIRIRDLQWGLPLSVA